MLSPEQEELLAKIQKNLKVITNATLLLTAAVMVLVYVMVVYPDLGKEPQPIELAKTQEPLPEFENGIHLATGFKEGENLNLVIANCTSCHSAKMITQNFATREGWKTMIKWMQETQSLWDLGEGEPLILDYLAKYYAPGEAGRRKPLTNIDWYELED
jgi:hypothetical protein